MTGRKPKEKPTSELRLHKGDIMSPDKRSAVMSRIRGRGTKPELLVEEALRAEGLAFETHASDLPGRPDVVFRAERLAVFVDGDFWHGYRFEHWRLKLSEKWEAKIAATRRRDRRTHRLLRQSGWRVLRLWEHQVMTSPERCVGRIRRALGL